MKAVTVRDRDAGIAGLALGELPYPHAAENDVVVPGHELVRGRRRARRGTTGRTVGVAED